MSRQRPPAGWIGGLARDPAGNAHEVILDRLRNAILSGLAPPGLTVNVDDVAEHFAVSRIPVREALKTLIGESLVDHRPREGYLVAQLTHAELAEFYVVREALEAAALAAAVRHANVADDDEVSAAYQALSAAIAAADTPGHHRESRRFHLALVRPSGMGRLLRMFEAAWNITEPLRPMSYVEPRMTQLLDDDHLVMRDAFAARDREALIAACTQHYRRLQDVVAALPTDTGLFG